MFTVDLTLIEGTGNFHCPSCGAVISSNDESGSVYEIVEITAKEHDAISNATIECKKCGNLIHLLGLRLLKKFGYSDRLFEVDSYTEFVKKTIAQPNTTLR